MSESTSTTSPVRSYAKLESLIAQHGNDPKEVAWAIEQAIGFIQTQSRLDCDADKQQALIQDLDGIRIAFENL